VTEAVRVHLLDAGSLPQPTQPLLEAVRPQCDAGGQRPMRCAGNEEWPGLISALDQVIGKR
jgi:hypothetical protein